MTLHADSADPTAIRGAVAIVTGALGPLDVAVVNAGLLRLARLQDLALEDLDAMLSANVRGVVLALQASASAMRVGGRLITIGSNSAIRTGSAIGATYAMTHGRRRRAGARRRARPRAAADHGQQRPAGPDGDGHDGRDGTPAARGHSAAPVDPAFGGGGNGAPTQAVAQVKLLRQYGHFRFAAPIFRRGISPPSPYWRSSLDLAGYPNDHHQAVGGRLTLHLAVQLVLDRAGDHCPAEPSARVSWLGGTANLSPAKLKPALIVRLRPTSRRASRREQTARHAWRRCRQVHAPPAPSAARSEPVSKRQAPLKDTRAGSKSPSCSCIIS